MEFLWSKIGAAGNQTFLPIPATFKLRCYQQSRARATSGNWVWLLPVLATIRNSHFKNTPIWGLRWPPLKFCIDLRTRHWHTHTGATSACWSCTIAKAAFMDVVSRVLSVSASTLIYVQAVHTVTTHCHNTLSRHTVALSWHTVTLSRHTVTLSQHTVILSHCHNVTTHCHIVTLSRHTVTLSRHTVTLSQHTVILSQHTVTLSHCHNTLSHCHTVTTHCQTVTTYCHTVTTHCHTVTTHCHDTLSHCHATSTCISQSTRQIAPPIRCPCWEPRTHRHAILHNNNWLRQ